MKAKIYLESYERLYHRVERITEQIAALDARATGTKSFRYNHDKITSSNQTDIYDIVDRKVQLESIVEHLQLEMDDIEAGIKEAVSDMSGLDRKIAAMTWLEFEGSVYIAQALHIGRRSVFRHRQMIMDHVQDYIDGGNK